MTLKRNADLENAEVFEETDCKRNVMDMKS
jgi:hypothetical protein